jgi:hypothetical protein
VATHDNPWGGFGAALSHRMKARIRSAACAAVDATLGWPSRPTAEEILNAAAPYMRDALRGEAVLTLGGPLLAWRQGHVDGVVCAGPHECMPNKIAESQFFHIAEDEGLVSLTLPLNGDPMDAAVLDNFAFEVHSRFRRSREVREEAGRSQTAAGKMRTAPGRPRDVRQRAESVAPGK